MVRRFQIEDIIAQDASGVVFHALDHDTGQWVAIRRFFPFGAEGGGLTPEEQAAYRIAVERLATLSHPALRTVICGGCDPVDGVPFIATEWVEGEPLADLMAREPLPLEAATLLISQALEVCELLSHVFAEEAVWIETKLQTVIVSPKETGRGFTFWISPLKWLGGGENRGLDALVTLTEEIMGWQGRLVNEQAGRGLGGWLKWLRGAAGTTSLREARDMLAASVGTEPPAPARQLIAQATRKPLPKLHSAKAPSQGPVVAMALLAVIVLGLAVWFFTARSAGTSPAPIAGGPPVAGTPSPASHRPPPVAGSSKVARANRRALEIQQEATRAGQAHEAALASQQAAAQTAGGAIQWNHRELILAHVGQPATVTGTIRGIQRSSKGKTIYLLFGEAADPQALRAGLRTSSRPATQVEAELVRWVGKKVLVTGEVSKPTKVNRQLEIIMADASAVREAP